MVVRGKGEKINNFVCAYISKDQKRSMI
jgi:hypothetical protein